MIIPAFNEEASILKAVQAVEGHGYDYVVVNDGSTDSTLQLCRDHHVNVLNLVENLGIGGAVQAGHRYALMHDYDIDVQFDGDGQHDIDYMKDLVETIEQGADLVIGSRFLSITKGYQSTYMRRLGIRWLSFLIRVFGKMRISDPTSGFRASGRRAIQLFSADYPMDYPEPESIITALRHGLTVREIPVTMKERQGGRSSIKAFSGAYYMIKVSLAITITSLARKGSV